MCGVASVSVTLLILERWFLADHTSAQPVCSRGSLCVPRVRHKIGSIILEWHPILITATDRLKQITHVLESADRVKLPVGQPDRHTLLVVSRATGLARARTQRQNNTAPKQHRQRRFTARLETASDEP